MEILLFKTFEKRKNSTKVPDDSLAITKNVKLKGECSIVNPSFFLGDAELYSYVKAWGNYYFVDRIAYDINGAQYINCSIDVLASWKSQILETSAFVKYSTTDYSLLIHDDRVVPEVGQIVHSRQEASMFLNDGSEAYIITAVSEDGGVNNYYVGFSTLKTMIQTLLEKTNDWYESIFTSLTDALGSIQSIMAIPITDLSTAGSKQLMLGTLDLDIGTAPVLTDIRAGYKRQNVSLPIDRGYSDFRKGSNFTSMSLYLPFVGTIELSPDDFLDSEAVNIRAIANCLTGSVIYRITDSNDVVVGTYSGTFGRQIPLGNTRLTNVTKGIGEVASLGALGLAAVASGGALGIAGLASGISAGINAFINFNKHTSTMIGGYEGSYGEFLQNNYILTVSEQPSRINPDNLTELYGNPCSKVRKIEGLTGYVETIGFDIDISAVSEIKDLINSAMDRGVYIE